VIIVTKALSNMAMAGSKTTRCIGDNINGK
jgi:hypothetical protein